MGVRAAMHHAVTTFGNFGINLIGMQMPEHGWSVIKMVQSHRGNPNNFNFLITSKYVDAITYGAIACDQVDPRKIKRISRVSMGTIDFDPEFKDTMMANVVNSMPERGADIVRKLFNIETGKQESIDSSLIAPFYKNAQWHKKQKMLSKSVKLRYRAILLSENEIMGDEFDITSATKRYSRKAILQNLKDNMDDTSDVDLDALQQRLDSAGLSN